jgi:hypothetical protein
MACQILMSCAPGFIGAVRVCGDGAITFARPCAITLGPLWAAARASSASALPDLTGRIDWETALCHRSSSPRLPSAAVTRLGPDRTQHGCTRCNRG